METKVFKGVNVFMSRNLVPPELYDTLLGALQLNGATVFLCCDPSHNAPNEYHIIASRDHEKFKDLRSKGFNLLGPQCVLSCAKEKRSIPNQGFTCCLAMDGVNILASGFDKDEKADIESMVTAMGGVLHIKASSDVSFVIVKNVLAQKYKWALHNLKKPAVNINWLNQCWKEHRLVPQEPHRVLPFSGLTICVSGFPLDERKEIGKLAVQNGGKYSAALTRSCTHLICDAPESDKYKAAKRWGHIHIVSRKWFHQSVARKGCLNEESYPVERKTISSASTVKTPDQDSQGISIKKPQFTASLLASVSDSETIFSAQASECVLKNLPPNMHWTVTEAPLSKGGNDLAANQRKSDSTYDFCVADDTQSEDDNDLYLCECKILIVGFEASQMRMLVNMVRRGGGSRYMSFSEKLTHVIVGRPSENETREARNLAALGVINVVKTAWLEECNCKKQEIPVLQRHIAYDVLLPKDSAFLTRPTETMISGVKQGKLSASQPVVYASVQETKSSLSQGVKQEAKLRALNDLSNVSTVFNGKLFSFSRSFPEEQRPEIVQWVIEGGGEMSVDPNEKNVHFTVERHGVMCSLTYGVRNTCVSSHWIHSCLKEGNLIDISSHVLFSPLQCNIPFPGLAGYRFCVTQYDLKERQLLRNLCYVLGVKFIDKLNKKVTHLFCKFTDGDKYKAACRWRIQIVTADWLYECVMQNKVVDLKGFSPKDLTSEEREAGVCSVSQYPTQSAWTSSSNASQYPSQSQGPKSMARDQNKLSSRSKRARLIGSDYSDKPQPRDIFKMDSLQGKKKLPGDSAQGQKNIPENYIGVSPAVPDVATTIEDLLAQTSKIQDHKSQETSGCHENFMSSNPTLLGQRSADPRADSGQSKHWMNMSEKKEEYRSANVVIREACDGFSETQTDSQVVGYEEDLSGRQMIIDRVRSSSSGNSMRVLNC